MVGDEWVNYQMEAYKYKNGAYPANMEALFGNEEYLKAFNEGKWIDWVDEVAGNTATTQKYNLSVTGGNDKTKIFSSVSYTKDTGLIQGEERNHYALRLNIDQEIFSWAKAGFTSNITYTDHDRAYNKCYTAALSAMPLGDAYNEKGEVNHEYIQNQYSPMSDLIENQYVNSTKSTYINANGYLEITPIKGLSLKTQASASISTSRLGQFWGTNANANLPTYGKAPFAQKTHNDGWGYVWENILSYNTTIAKDHTISASLVSSWKVDQEESTIGGGTGQLVESWLFHQLTSTNSEGRYLFSDFSQTQQMGLAFRFNYSYKGKYLFTFSNRRDGVSWLMEGEKWDNFPAAALAWRISEETFMQNTRSWLDNLKLRMSYGVTGNAGGVGAYVTGAQAVVWAANGISIDGNSVSFAQYNGTFGGSGLGWEKSYNFNIGLDFVLFNNRIDGSIDYFNTRTKGLLFKRTLPITSGLTGWGSPLSSWQNLAETSNHGIETTINARVIQNKDFKWNMGVTATWSREKIEKLPAGDIINESLFEGEPIKAVYGYKYAGLWGTDTDQEILDAYGVKPGFIKIETIDKVTDGVSDNGVHKYSQNDRMILGHYNPDWILGWNNSFIYKDFDLTIYTMARLGQTIESDLMGWYSGTAGVTTNQLAGVDYWTENNQDAYYPRPGSYNDQSAVFSALRMVDGSFIKIKNITLGYTLPHKISSKAFINKARIYATVYNPYIYAFDKQLRKVDVDPETGGSDVFPTYKQFVFGVNITF